MNSHKHHINCMFYILVFSDKAEDKATQCMEKY